MYLCGVPSSGKSLITEGFFVNLYGLENVGLINFTDKKYSVEQAIDKKIILINEYKHHVSNRELMLKLLDGSLITVNRKYQSSTKQIITGHSTVISNYSMAEQNMDEAMKIRFKEFELPGSLDSKNLTYTMVLEEFPLLVIIYMIAYNISKQIILDKNGEISLELKKIFISLFKNKMKELAQIDIPLKQIGSN